MKCTTIISAVAFAVIFLSALFLFMRNYPSDRWFSVVFIVAGGVLLWCAWGVGETGAAGVTNDANKYENTTSNTIDTNDNMNKIEGINRISDNIVDETTNQRE